MKQKAVNTEQFATLEDIKELGDALWHRVTDYYENLAITKRITTWRNVFQTKYSGYYSKGSVLRKGPTGAKRKIYVNHFKNLLQHLVVMTISQRPSWDPRAVNSDHKTYSQVILAKGLLDYYMRQKELEKYLAKQVELSTDYGEGYLLMEWDEDAGDIYGEQGEDNLEQEIEKVIEDESPSLMSKKIGLEDGPEGLKNIEKDEETPASKQKVVKTGDVVFSVYSPIDVIRDCSEKKLTDCNWYIIRRYVNKFDYAEKYPDFRDDIVTWYEEKDVKNVIAIEERLKKDSTDIIPIYTFYHKKTASVPKGKMVEFINADIVTFNGDLPYDEIPVYELVPEYMESEPFGYSVSFDLLAIQDVINMLHSTIVTNQNAFGVQNIAAPKGSGIEVTEISDGLNLIEYHEQKKPEPLPLLATPAEIFNYLKDIEKGMETISGVNSTARGNPESSLKSGAALALVQSMAIQFSSNLQNGYVRLLEKVGTGLVKLLQEYATVPRVATIAGKTNRTYMREFKSEDLSEIDRVIVDAGNPLSKTTAGKVDMAKELLESGMIKTPEQYLQVLNTGQIEPMTEGVQSELMLIKSENEKLMDGKETPVTAVDNHITHITEHKCVLASPEARVSEVVGVVLNHIQQHIVALQTTDPFLLTVIGQPVAQPMGPAPDVADQKNPDKTPQPQPKQPNMPNMPKNALTNETWNAETGGL